MQSDYRFTLIDRNGTPTVIPEPTGWADFTARISRNMDTHGTINEIQANSFEFTGDTAALIRTEYLQYAAQGDMVLQVEARGADGFEFLYRGQLSFGDTYKAEYNGENGYYCVKIDCDQTGPHIDLVNRYDQSVDLTAVKCFDGETDLADYNFINFPISLPSKAILLKSYATVKQTDQVGDNLTYEVLNDADYSNLPNTAQKGVVVHRLNQVDSQEITDFKPAYQFDYIQTTTQSLKMALAGNELLDVKYASTIIGENTYNLDILLKGSLTLQYRATGGAQGSVNYKLTVYVKYKNLQDVLTPFIVSQNIYSVGNSAQPTIRTIPINYVYVGSVNMSPGEKLWVYYELETFNQTTGNISLWQSIKFTADPASHAGISSFTKAIPTNCQVSMTHEALSRTVETITNNQLKVYSEYYGRTDSQPFAYPSNGCGANRILTNGKAIRKIIVPSDPGGVIFKSPNVGMFTSLKDEFLSLKAVDNIGMGIIGNTVRIEPCTWFYKDDVIMTCKNVFKIRREVKKEEIYKTFKFGYEKWEGEDSNGLDDFFGKREYRLDIRQATSTLEQISKFIASGYAIEVTRRRGSDSSDWRYDKDIFMICVEPDGTSYKVEINNIGNAGNIIDPPTIYNFRISPVRNALRWFNRVIGSYRNVNTGHRIIFGSGDANYIATGENINANCKLEVAGLSENQDLTLSLFQDQAAGMPIMWPERVVYSYPMGRAQYHYLQANPYGRIEFTSVSENGSGWIQQVDYRASQAEADFILIPKIQ